MAGGDPHLRVQDDRASRAGRCPRAPAPSSAATRPSRSASAARRSGRSRTTSRGRRRCPTTGRRSRGGGRATRPSRSSPRPRSARAQPCPEPTVSACVRREREHGRRRAARRLRLDRRDRDAPRRGDRGAVPRAAVRRRSATRGSRRSPTCSSRSSGWRDRRAVVIFTLVEPTLRAVMRDALRRRPESLLRPARPAARRGREGVGHGGRDEARGRARRSTSGYFKRIAAIEFAVKNDDGLGRGARERRRRARRRLAHLEDAALDLPRLPRLEGGERAAREGDRAAGGAVPDRPGEDRRADDRRASAWPRSAASGSC